MPRPSKPYSISDLFNHMDSVIGPEGKIRKLHQLNLSDVFDSLSPLDWVNLDEDLRAVSYSYMGPYRLAQTITPEWMQNHLLELNQQPHLVYFLACHANGHVREVAVQLMGRNNEKASTALLLVRANDWVKAVRDQAHSALSLQIDPAFVQHWIELFPLATRLMEGTRTETPAWFPELLNLLSRPEHRQKLKSCFANLEDETRKSLMQVIKNQLDDSAWRPVLKSDPSVQIRRMLAQHAPVEWLSSLIQDSDFKTREKVFLRLAQEGDPAETFAVLQQALLDVRSGIRAIAQHHLKQQGQNVRDLYLQKVPALQKETTGLAGGLADLGTLEDLPLLEALSRSTHSPVRAEALRGLGRLAPQKYISELEDAVLEVNRISTVAVKALKNAGLLSEQPIQRLWLKANTPQQRKHLMDMALQLPRYQAAAVLLEWRPDVNPAEGGVILSKLQNLLKGYGVKYFLKASKDLSARIRLSLEQQDLPRNLKATLLDLSNH